MDEFYNKHYITIDDLNRITDGWSDGPHPDRDTTGAICINEKGGYQFRLTPGGEENLPLHTMDGIPLYRWDGEQVMRRSEEEITAERLPSLMTAKLAELSAACNTAIVSGCDVVLTDSSTGHISLTAEDQINLYAAADDVKNGATRCRYHLDKQMCTWYSASDIVIMAQAAAAHKLWHTTYYNHLASWVRRCEAAEEVQAITYGADLPEDLADRMAALLDDEEGETDVV